MIKIRMLIDSKKILLRARLENFAVGQFNTSDLEITKAIVRAAEKLKAPVIIGTSPKAIDFAGLEEIAGIIQTEAEGAQIPIVLHLDHGKNLEIVERCLEAGFTSVMFDGSNLAFEENLKLTKKVSDIAHRHNVPVEGELGAVGGGEKYQIKTLKFLTDPEKALEFIQKTNIDSLAIAIGNAHGIPTPEEKLDFARLAQIKKLVSVPLVLHGASSTPKEDIQKAISLGISKINIDTDIRLTFTNNLKEFIKNHPEVWDPREILESVMEAVAKVVENKIRLFGSAGKAEKY